VTRKPRALLLTCEHASAAVPDALRERFLAHHGDERILETHRAYDIGARSAARFLAKALGAPLLETEVSRLVVDANRHRSHPRVLGPAFSAAEPELREALLTAHHDPHRARVREAVGKGPVLHLAVHSMTSQLEGLVRGMDMALLYDPARPTERRLADDWKHGMQQRVRGIRLRRNAPYRGVSDGLPTSIRKELPDARYAGFELELNQRAFANGRWPREWLDELAATIDRMRSAPARRLRAR